MRLLAVLVVVSTITGCRDLEALELTFHGQDFVGIGTGSFDIQRTALREIGRADRVNVPDGDGLVYALPDVDPGRAVVAIWGNGLIQVFIARAIAVPSPGRDGENPWAGAVPELCRYWKSLPWECGGPSPPPPPTREPGGARGLDVG